MNAFTPDKSRAELIRLIAERYGYKEGTIENYIYTNKFFSNNVYELIKDIPKLDKQVKAKRETYLAMHPSKNPKFVAPEPQAEYEIKLNAEGIPDSMEDKKEMARRLFNKMNEENPELLATYAPYEKTKSIYLSLFCAMHKVKQPRMHAYIYTQKLFEGKKIPELIFMPEYVNNQIQEFEAKRIQKENTLQEQRTDKEMNTMFKDPTFEIPFEPVNKEEPAPVTEYAFTSIDPSTSLSSVTEKIDSEIMKKKQEIETLEKVKSFISTIGTK